MKQLLLVFVCILLTTDWPYCQENSSQQISQSKLIEDLQYLRSLFVDTHPDPYTSFGGQVAFHQYWDSLESGIPAQGLEIQVFYKHLKPFFARLADSHSGLQIPKSSTTQTPRLYPPLQYEVLNGVLYVSSTRTDFDHLFGAKILTIEGHNLNYWVNKARLFYPTENKAGAMRALDRLITGNNHFEALFKDHKDYLNMEFETANGNQLAQKIYYNENLDQRKSGIWKTQEYKLVKNQDELPFYCTWLNNDETAYIRIKTFNGREGFEFLRSWGRTDLKNHLTSFYSKYMQSDIPDNLDEAILNVPSLSETFHKTLTELEATEKKQLIIDIRENGGGWSAMGEIIYYLLYADKYLEWESPVCYATKISQTHLNLQGMSLQDYNQNQQSQYKLGDYRIRYMRSKRSLTEKRNQFLSKYDDPGYSFKALMDQAGQFAKLNLSVAVLVDEGTFSAAYHFMYYMWQMGASIIGSPPAQAGNAFVDNCSWELPHSGLKGHISRTAQIYFPGNQQMGIDFTPEIAFTWDQLNAYGFTKDALVQWFLDKNRVN